MKKNGQRRCKYIVSGRDESTDSWHTSGYNLCSFPVDLFIYSYETDFIQGFLRKTKRSQPDPLISGSAILIASIPLKLK